MWRGKPICDLYWNFLSRNRIRYYFIQNKDVLCEKRNPPVEELLVIPTQHSSNVVFCHTACNSRHAYSLVGHEGFTFPFLASAVAQGLWFLAAEAKDAGLIPAMACTFRWRLNARCPCAARCQCTLNPGHRKSGVLQYGIPHSLCHFGMWNPIKPKPNFPVWGW